MNKSERLEQMTISELQDPDVQYKTVKLFYSYKNVH